MAINDADRKRTDESYEKLYKKRKINTLVATISLTSIIAGLSFFVIGLFNFNNEKKVDTYFKSGRDVKDLQMSFDSLLKSNSYSLHKFQAQVEMLHVDSGKNTDDNKIGNRRFYFIEQRIKRDSILISNLRASINPDKPEEVLRLARLNDKIEQLKQDNINLKDNLKSEEAKFETAVNNQLSNSRTFYIALITILAPITFKFIMQLFKDFNKSTD